jgi:hypothetical protein
LDSPWIPEEFCRPSVQNEKARERDQHKFKSDCLLDKFTVRQKKEGSTVWGIKFHPKVNCMELGDKVAVSYLQER